MKIQVIRPNIEKTASAWNAATRTIGSACGQTF